nr:hypothetical protein Iba_chr04eCG13180 [Ipomoea batatas]
MELQKLISRYSQLAEEAYQQLLHNLRVQRIFSLNIVIEGNAINSELVGWNNWWGDYWETAIRRVLQRMKKSPKSRVGRWEVNIRGANFSVQIWKLPKIFGNDSPFGSSILIYSLLTIRLRSREKETSLQP